MSSAYDQIRGKFAATFEEGHRLSAAYSRFWTFEVAPPGRDYIRIAEMPPVPAVFDPSAIVDMDTTVSMKTIELKQWAMNHSGTARTERDAWRDWSKLTDLGLHASVQPIPPRAGKDPGDARRFLVKERGYTNRKVKRLPISVLKRRARQLWPRLVHARQSVIIGVDPERFHLYVAADQTAAQHALAWVCLAQLHGEITGKVMAAWHAQQTLGMPDRGQGENLDETWPQFNERVRRDFHRMRGSRFMPEPVERSIAARLDR